MGALQGGGLGAAPARDRLDRRRAHEARAWYGVRPRHVTLAVALDELRDAEQARVRSALRPLLVGSAVDARSPFRA